MFLYLSIKNQHVICLRISLRSLKVNHKERRLEIETNLKLNLSYEILKCGSPTKRSINYVKLPI